MFMYVIISCQLLGSKIKHCIVS